MPETAPETLSQDREKSAAEALSLIVRAAEDSEIGALQALADELDEAVFVVDQERNLVLFNSRAEAITGYSRSEVLGRHCLSGIKCTHCLQSCGIFERGQIRGVPLQLIRKDGSTLSVIKSASVLRDGRGDVIGAIEIFRPAPAEHDNKEQTGGPALESNAVAWSGLEIMLSSLNRSFLVLDQDFNIQRVSASFANLLGTVSGALAGRPAARILGEQLCDPQSAFRTGLQAGQRREGWRAVVQRVDGAKQPLSVTGAPLLADEQCDGEQRFSSKYLLVVRPEPVTDELGSESSQAIIFEGMLARSQSMRRIFHLVDHLYDSDVSVLITGESGTGKELLARAVHARSERANHPFVAVNCGALPANLLESELFGHARGSFTGAVRDVAGRFEVTGEGTLFLDEIGDLPLPLQVKLLRVLQQRTFERVGETRSRKFRGRIVAATHQDLAQMVAQKRFREDLYYRLNVVPLRLPPLRERREDLELLIRRLLEVKGQRRSRALRLSPSAMRLLMTHDWPGNVRQLENAIEYATAVCEGQTIHPEDLPAELLNTTTITTGLSSPHTLTADSANSLPGSTASAPREATTPAASRQTDLAAPGDDRPRYLSDAEILSALQVTRYNRRQAAQRLGISRTTLWRRLKQIHGDEVV